ncbi:MAG: helix-turn-helix transcriptional regulator [Lachnospiraceae bacterium]|nr:helix-turn-helix transcriptional regulator [Lachnospiraceae bacterium]
MSIGKNIRDIRKAYGETQAELANVINVEHNAISMYESGKRIPDISIIQMIAEHYGLPVDRIIMDDFSNANFRISSLSWDKMMGIFDCIFPVVYTEHAREDKHFKKGYECTINIKSCIKNPQAIEIEEMVDLALKEYEKSYMEFNNIEAIVNSIFLIFIKGSFQLPEHYVDAIKAIYNGEGLTENFAKKYMLNNLSNNNDNMQKFIHDLSEVLLEQIRFLKLSDAYGDLADYYIAIRYIIGFVDNNFNDELNKTIGIEMLKSCLEMGNKYAKDFVRSIVSL